MSENKEHRDIVDLILKILVDKQLSARDALNIVCEVQKSIQASAESAWDRPLTVNENEWKRKLNKQERIENYEEGIKEGEKKDKITLKRQCNIGSPFFITINGLKVNMNHIVSIEAYNTDNNIVFAVHLSDKRRLEECYQIYSR